MADLRVCRAAGLQHAVGASGNGAEGAKPAVVCDQRPPVGSAHALCANAPLLQVAPRLQETRLVELPRRQLLSDQHTASLPAVHGGLVSAPKHLEWDMPASVVPFEGDEDYVLGSKRHRRPSDGRPIHHAGHPIPRGDVAVGLCAERGGSAASQAKAITALLPRSHSWQRNECVSPAQTPESAQPPGEHALYHTRAGPDCVDELLSDVNRTYTGFYAIKRIPRDPNAQVVRKVLQMGAYSSDLGRHLRLARAEADDPSNQPRLTPLARRPASTGRRLRADAAAQSRCYVKEQGWSRNIPSRV